MKCGAGRASLGIFKAHSTVRCMAVKAHASPHPEAGLSTRPCLRQHGVCPSFQKSRSCGAVLAPAMEGAAFTAVTLNRADLRFPFEPRLRSAS